MSRSLRLGAASLVLLALAPGCAKRSPPPPSTAEPLSIFSPSLPDDFNEQARMALAADVGVEREPIGLAERGERFVRDIRRRIAGGHDDAPAGGGKTPRRRGRGIGISRSHERIVAHDRYT